MTRLTPINPAEATGKAKELLSAVEAKLRFTPNMMRTMAVSPAVLDGYLCFSSALGGGARGCASRWAPRARVGKRVGLTTGAMGAGRQGRSSDPKSAGALAFAEAIL